jgi:hypothetical protein
MLKSLLFAAVLFLPAIALAFSSGPPNGRTGAPGEQTCWNNCHNSFPLNSGDGDMSISGPEFFSPGQTYTISVGLSDPGQSRWGFEITPLDIGSIAITDPANTQLSNSGDNTYVKHTSAGTYAGNQNGPVSWSFDWTAPDNPPSQVVFYAAGNAANNNGSGSGDFIYTTSFTSTLTTTGIDDDPFATLPSHLSMSNYPNPFNAATTISFNLPVSGHTSLEIYNLHGQLIETLMDGIHTAGEYNVVWNADDLPSGLYFYKLSVKDLTSTNKMTLIK